MHKKPSLRGTKSGIDMMPDGYLYIADLERTVKLGQAIRGPKDEDGYTTYLCPVCGARIGTCRCNRYCRTCMKGIVFCTCKDKDYIE